MQLEAWTDAAKIAERAAAIIAARSRAAFSERGRFTIALSGGPGTSQMIRYWGKEEVPWGKVFVFEVSEPIPPVGHPAAYFPRLREALAEDTPIDPRQIYPMPVSAANPLVGLRSYARTLERFAGSPAVIDLVYIGFETDADALKLVPGNPMLQVAYGDIGIAMCRGHRRMTLIHPVFKRARQIMCVVADTERAKALLEFDGAALNMQGSLERDDYSMMFSDRATRQTHSRKVQ